MRQLLSSTFYTKLDEETLGKIVEFDHKDGDKNLGNIENVLSFLDSLYDKNILEVRTDISELPLSLWTFIGNIPFWQKERKKRFLIRE